MELRTPCYLNILYTFPPLFPIFDSKMRTKLFFTLFSDFWLFVSLLCIIAIVNIWTILFLGCQICSLMSSLIVLVVLGCGRSRVEQLLPKLWLAIGGTPLLYQNRSFISLTNFVYILVGCLASKMIIFYTKSFIACRWWSCFFVFHATINELP